jgi:hypothetical protein
MGNKKESKYYDIRQMPFIMGEQYALGVYIGRYDAWDSNFGSFKFDDTMKITTIHPTEEQRIESIVKAYDDFQLSKMEINEDTKLTAEIIEVGDVLAIYEGINGKKLIIKQNQ